MKFLTWVLLAKFLKKSRKEVELRATEEETTETAEEEKADLTEEKEETEEMTLLRLLRQ